MKKQIMVASVFVFGMATLYFMQTTTWLPKDTKQESTTRSPDSDTKTASVAHDSVTEPIADQKITAQDDVESARDHKVLERLKRFIERTESFTAETVGLEREKIAHGLTLAMQKPTPMPATRQEKDRYGQPWDVLDFGNGIVRYLPSIEE